MILYRLQVGLPEHWGEAILHNGVEPLFRRFDVISLTIQQTKLSLRRGLGLSSCALFEFTGLSHFCTISPKFHFF